MKIAATVLLCLTAIACSDDDEAGIEVHVAVAGQDLGTDHAGAIVLGPSYFVVEATELVPCASVASRIWRVINPLPSAFAHGESSPLKLATPVVIPLSGAHASLIVGDIAPPPGDYCGVELELGPADDDAIGLPTDVDMVGKSLYVAGTDDEEDFSATLATTDHVHRSFAALTLDDGHRSANIIISVDVSALFDGIDTTSPTLASSIASKVSAAVQVNVQ